MNELKTITLDGVAYVRADQLPAPKSGKRCVLVLDRGWIVAGDVEDKDGRILVTRAVHVRSWSNIGFDGMLLASSGSKDVVLKRLPDVNVPADSELFRVPVGDNWGL